MPTIIPPSPIFSPLKTRNVMRNIRVSRAFKRMTPSEMLSFSLAVKTNLSSKPRYTALQTLTAELTAACDAFTIAETAAKEGGATERILRDAKMVDLRATLEKIALQLELMASEPPDETAILDAGYQLQGVPGARVRTPLGRAEIVSIKRGKKSGSIQGKCRPMSGVVKFSLEWSDDNGAHWHNGTYSQGSLFLMEGLTAEKRYWFRACPLGTHRRIGDWSEPATLFVL